MFPASRETRDSTGPTQINFLEYRRQDFPESIRTQSITITVRMQQILLPYLKESEKYAIIFLFCFRERITDNGIFR